MVTVKVSSRETGRQASATEMNQKLSVQVQEILEAANQAADDEKPETLGWHYRIPAAGVRYYGF